MLSKDNRWICSPGLRTKWYICHIHTTWSNPPEWFNMFCEFDIWVNENLFARFIFWTIFIFLLQNIEGGFRQIWPRTIGPRTVGPRTTGPRTVGPLDNWAPDNRAPGQLGPGQLGPWTIGPRTVGPLDSWAPDNWAPGQKPSNLQYIYPPIVGRIYLIPVYKFNWHVFPKCWQLISNINMKIKKSMLVNPAPKGRILTLPCIISTESYSQTFGSLYPIQIYISKCTFPNPAPKEFTETLLLIVGRIYRIQICIL